MYKIPVALCLHLHQELPYFKNIRTPGGRLNCSHMRDKVWIFNQFANMWSVKNSCFSFHATQTRKRSKNVFETNTIFIYCLDKVIYQSQYDVQWWEDDVTVSQWFVCNFFSLPQALYARANPVFANVNH